MKSLIVLTTLILAIIIVLAAGPGTTALARTVDSIAGQVDAPTAAVIKIVPASSAIPLNGTVTLDIAVESVTDLFGLAVELTFNPAILQVQDADGTKPGIQIEKGTCPQPDFVVQNIVDNTLGKINYDVSSLAPTPACNGSGTIARITFKGVAAGTSPVHYTNALLSDPNGMAIQVSPQDGSVTVSAVTNTGLAIDPATVTVPISTTVTTDIRIANVTNLYGIQLKLTFDPLKVAVVDADPVKAGVQIIPGSFPVPDFVVQNLANNTSGVIEYTVTAMAPSLPSNGNGIVARIQFHGLAQGVSPVHFDSYLLSDNNGYPIPVASTQDGSLTVLANGTVSGKITLLGRSNHSGAQVCAYSGATQVLCVTTNAAGDYALSLPAGSYTIKVEMSRYLDTQKTSVSVTPGVTTSLPLAQLSGGDTNDDDVINILDLSFIGSRINTNPASPNWDVRADINNDSTVNILDLSPTGSNFGKTSPTAW